jgi:hypothetical protein
MNTFHSVQSTQVDRDYFYLAVDGKQYRIPWAKCSPRLAKATLAQRKRLEISPSGYGIHWPEIDEDLAITPLLRGAQVVSAAPSPKSRLSSLRHASKKAA